MKRVLICSALLGALTITSQASAQEEHWDRKQQNRVYLDFDVFPFEIPTFTAEPVKVVSMGFAAVGQIELTDHVFLDAEIPWAVLTGEFAGDSETYGVFGNITLGAHYADTINDDLAWWAGLSFAVPTMLMDNPDLEQAFTGSYAVAARGLYDAHRFFPEHVTLLPGGGIELRYEFFRYRGELRFANHIPVDGDFVFILEQGNEGELRADFGLGGGLRFQEAFPLTERDKVQTALEPFVGYEPPGAGFLARFGVLLALDEDLGPFNEQGKVASFRFTLGGKW